MRQGSGGLRLAGKTAVPTGAAIGLGEAIARRFAKEGARVVCVDVEPEPNEALVRSIEAEGGGALSVIADVGPIPKIRPVRRDTWTARRGRAWAASERVRVAHRLGRLAEHRGALDSCHPCGHNDHTERLAKVAKDAGDRGPAEARGLAARWSETRMGIVVGARELKTRLGAYLGQVRRGVTIVVTERGSPVAELRPLGRGARGVAARLDELVALGVLSRPSKKALAPFRPIRATGRPLSEAIIEDRTERV